MKVMIDENNTCCLDLDMMAVQVRAKYSVSLQKLSHLYVKRKLKNIERVNIPPTEKISPKHLNFSTNDGSSLLDEKLRANLISSLKQHSRVIAVLNRNKGCPVANMMEKL